jgi:hypothetical protein
VKEIDSSSIENALNRLARLANRSQSVGGLLPLTKRVMFGEDLK